MILDYVKWRGDLSFAQDAFNCIDSLIFARAAYFHWHLIQGSDSGTTFQHAYKQWCELDLSHVHMLASEDPQLFMVLAASERFKDCGISDFVNIIDEQEETQFCAITFHVCDHLHYIAYRGTDNTLIGWKEDFNMCLEPEIPAQRYARTYLKQIAGKYRGKFMIGGHSKGGNLAVYSALFAPAYIQRRILQVDNFDGPGLSQTLYEKRKDHEMYQKVRIFYPQNSMIGRFLYQKNLEAVVIQSTKKGIYQHDLYSWQIVGKQFVVCDKFDQQSEIFEKALKDFQEKIPPEQRKVCVEILFDALSSAHEPTIHDVALNWKRSSASIMKSLSKLESDERKIIAASLKGFMDALMSEYKQYYDRSKERNT